MSRGTNPPCASPRTDLEHSPHRPLKIVALGSAASAHDANRTSVFARMGHSVGLISIADASVPGVTVIPVRGNGVPVRALRRFVLMASTVKALLSQRADIWHAHYAADYGTWVAALLARKPLVITVMGGDVLFDEQGTQGPMGRALTRFALRRADLVLVKSNALADVVASFGVDRARIVRVIWGIDLARFQVDPVEVARLRTEWGTQGRQVLLSPRMLRPFYNHQLLIEALPAIVGAGHDPVVVLTVKGESAGYRQQLEESARALGVLDRLRFVPPRL